MEFRAIPVKIIGEGWNIAHVRIHHIYRLKNILKLVTNHNGSVL